MKIEELDGIMEFINEHGWHIGAWVESLRTGWDHSKPGKAGVTLFKNGKHGPAIRVTVFDDGVLKVWSWGGDNMRMYDFKCSLSEPKFFAEFSVTLRFLYNHVNGKA